MADYNKPDNSNGAFNIETGSQIHVHKNFDLSPIGGLIATVPRPNPRSLSIINIEMCGFHKGDLIYISRDNSNNPSIDVSQYQKVYDARKRVLMKSGVSEKDAKSNSEKLDNLSNEILIPNKQVIHGANKDLMFIEQGVIQVKTIPDGVVGIVKEIQGNRVLFWKELKTDFGSVAWPKPGGVATRILGYDNNFIDERDTETIEKWKKRNRKSEKVLFSGFGEGKVQPGKKTIQPKEEKPTLESVKAKIDASKKRLGRA